MTKKVEKNTIIEKYIKHKIKCLLLESQAIDVQAPGSSTLTFELNKPSNHAFPIGAGEKSKIQQAVKKVYPALASIDVNKNEIVFDKEGTPSNFHIVIRKISNLPKSNQFKYVMWYVPFKVREDIDKPGNVNKKESDLFDKNVSSTELLNIVYNFLVEALLMN